MLLICEHDNETIERICYTCEHTSAEDNEQTERSMVGIDENNLAWFYIAPEYQDREISQKLVRWALGLIGPEAWAVIQTNGSTDQALFTESGLRVIESFENEADHAAGISVHIAQTP